MPGCGEHDAARGQPPGGHHFGGDYDRVAALILRELR